jgi:hypothetical protein
MKEGWDEIIPFLWCLVGGDSQCKDGVNESGISPSSKKLWTTSSLVLSPHASLTVPILSPLSPLTRARRHHHARPLPSPPEARRQSPSSIPAARSQSPSSTTTVRSRSSTSQSHRQAHHEEEQHATPRTSSIHAHVTEIRDEPKL